MILVTGAAGFIGSVLVSDLNKAGREDIIVVDRLESDEKWKNLRALKFSEYIHADDLLDERSHDLFEDVSCIFHMGACSSTTERDVDFLMKNNADYSKFLFSVATELKIPFIYASSAATYGDGESGYSDSHEVIDKLRPLNAYGYSKQVFDQWALKQKDQPPVWFGLKFFNVFGPNEYHKGEMRSLVHKAFGQINETGKVKLFKSHRDDFEDGKQLRDFVYAKDVSKAMLELMNAKEGSGIYNMGTGKARSFYDLVDATFKAMGLETNVEFIDMPESIRNQYQYYTQADMSKFKGLFPNFTFSDLEDAVANYVTNHLVQKDPYY